MDRDGRSSSPPASLPPAGRGIDAAYGSAALAYMIGFAVLLAVLCREPVQRALVRVLAESAASILAWTVVLAVPLLTFAGVSGDLMAARERARSRHGG